MKESSTKMNRLEIINHAAGFVQTHGDWAEFGVASGKTSKWIHELLPTSRELWLFDSFLGLPEPIKWNGKVVDKGHFSQTGGVPPARVTSLKRARVIQGLYDVTVQCWVDAYMSDDSKGKPLGLVHIDCDLYSSTKTVLEALGPDLIGVGTVIIFDEFHGWSEAENHEQKAFLELVRREKLTWEELAIGRHQLSLVVTGKGPGGKKVS